MEVRKGYKRTEVGVIPVDWELVSLGNLMVFKNGINASKERYGSGVKFINVLDILSNAPITYDSIIGKVQVSNSEVESYKISYGDILFQRSSETIEDAAQSNIYVEKEKTAVFGGFVIAGRKNGDYNPFYVNYQLKSNSSRKELTSQCGGSTRYNIGQKGLSTVKIPLPPTKTEQRAIATALSEADAYVAALEALIAKKRQVKQGVMKEVLTPGVGWREVRVKDHVFFQEGPGVRKWQFTDRGVKLLNGTNIQKGVLDLSNTNRFISEELAYGQYAHFLVDCGDILIACSGISVDRFEEKVSIAEEWHLPLCLNTSTMRFKVNEDEVDKMFFFHFLKSQLFKQQIGGAATGSAQLNFGPSHVEKVYMRCPPKPEQTRIATLLSALDEELTALEAQLAKARAVKTGMLADLLTGRVRLV
ncbi:hypothetical protein FUA23_11305 [Neolewinella aurantiaca]|uniref:Type I restriction modification DNA specificity domain-containing protein n=1 Tax=Neolewinella aurantiaca TaxID=2602767 RepID=A0A5C7FE39_9BACT|nr:restriction endonuclease subunit S [Neolewinella aurantiaca]TXF89324.1 hypothetical protein FUA23_11305 [Neolewinella aurantiaca]